MTRLTLFRRFAANRRRSRLLQPTLIAALLLAVVLPRSAYSAIGNLTTLLVCEGETAKLSCPSGRHIVVHLANFGRFSLQPCNPTMNLQINTQCQNENTMPLLRQRCDSRRECSFDATTTLFGDACPENAKYLETRYECVQDGESTTTSTTTPDPTTLRPADQTDGLGPNAGVDPIAPKEHCATRFSRYLLWPKTRSSHLAKLPCPAGTSGSAEWLCSSTGEWFPVSGPDLSGCISEWSRDLKADVAQRGDDPSSLLVVLRELYTSITREQLVGGDLINAVNVISTAIDTYNSLSNPPDGDGLMQTGADSVGFLLTSGQKATWMDLPADERRKQAATLLRTMHSMLRIATKNARFVSADSDVTVVKMSASQTPINGSSTDGTVSLPRSLLTTADHRDGEGALSPLHHGYASMERIGEYLDSLNAMNTDHGMVSRVVAISSGDDSAATSTMSLDEPIVVTFHTAGRGAAASNERLECMWWDSTRLAWIGNTRQRAKSGCWLTHHNSTHTVCECNILSAYVVATSDSAERYWLVHYWVITDFAVYASCPIAVILLLLVLGRVLRPRRGSTEPTAAVDKSARRTHLGNFVLCALVTELLICAIYAGSEEWALCAWLAALLRCAALVALSWMLLCAVGLYHRTLSVRAQRSSPAFAHRKDLITGGADHPSPSTIAKLLSYGFTYGLPAVLTIASIVWDWGSTLGEGGECRQFLNTTFAMMTLLPASLLLLCTIAFTAATLCSLCRYPSSVGHRKASATKLIDSSAHQALRSELKFNLLVTILLTACATFGVLWAIEAVAAGGPHSETAMNCAALLFAFSKLLLSAALFCFHPLSGKGKAAESRDAGVSRWMPRRLMSRATLNADEKERNNSINSDKCNFSSSPLGRGDATASTGTTSAASSEVSESPMLTAVTTVERTRPSVSGSRVYVGGGSRINSPYQMRSSYYCTHQQPAAQIPAGTLPYASGCHRHPPMSPCVGYGREPPDLRGGSEELLLPGQRYHPSQHPPSVHYGDGNGTYDYATIPYDEYVANAEACHRHYLSHPYHHYRQQAATGQSPCRSIRVDIPRVPHAACPSAVHTVDLREHGSSSHLHAPLHFQPNHEYHLQTLAGEAQTGPRSGRFRSAPPEFPPPPPPEDAVVMVGSCGCASVVGGENMADALMEPSSSVQLRQPPMQRVGSVNSGASPLGAGSSRSGTLVLKMDLSRWPPVYSEIQESDAEEMQ